MTECPPGKRCAQLSDGTLLEFPENTNNQVIQDTVKRIVQERAASSVSTAPSAAPAGAPATLPGADTVAQTPVQQAVNGAPKKTLSWGEVGVSAIQNVPSSGKQFFKDIWQAVRHPIETGGTLYDIADGAIRLAVPGGESPNEAKAKAVGDFFVERYGSVEGLKNTAANDPVGFLADLSMILTGGGTIAARAPGAAGKLATIASTAGRAIDPINIAAKTPKAIGAATTAAEKLSGVPVGTLKESLKSVATIPPTAILGGLTGVGQDVTRTIAETGYQGGRAGEATRKGMRFPIHDEIVKEARHGLAKLREARSKSYQSTMGKVAEVNTVLDFSKINEAFRSVADMGTFKGVNIKPSTQKIVADIGNVIDDWRLMDPTEFHTPMGLDALKKMVGDIRESTEWGTPSRIVADQVYHAIKNEIVKQAPEYGKAMSHYENMSDLILEIERSVGLGNKRSADTALRKLTSAMRNNVNTNFGKRQELVKILTESGAPDLLPHIAGTAANTWTPRGMQGPSTAAVGLGTTAAVATGAVPWWLVPALATTSPRLVGEALHAGGRVTRAGVDAARTAGQAINTPMARRLAGHQVRNPAAMMGRLERELYEKGQAR